MAKIKKRKKSEPFIPTSSMSDIAFLLLLFFMVSTVFVKERGLKVTLPKAKMIQKIPRNHAATIYVNSAGEISIDDFIIPIQNVNMVMLKKLQQDPNVISCFRADMKTRYKVINDIIRQLKEANCLRVSFEAKLKR